MRAARPGGDSRARGTGGPGAGVEAQVPGKQTLVEVYAGSAHTRSPSSVASIAPSKETHTPLDGAKAQHFGAKLGADFSGVQLHEGDGVAAEHGAAAVAFGRDIHFADGMLGGHASDALLGHELVHSIQQGSVPTHDGARLAEGTSSAAEV